MTESSSSQIPGASGNGAPGQPHKGKAFFSRVADGWLSIKLFDKLASLTLIVAVVVMAYWLFFASDRYVSEANIIIRKTDSLGAQSFDLGMYVSGIASADRANQLLMREYLLSVDMLKKLDAKLDLRTHYSDSSHDFVSRMWFHDFSMEWFYRYFLSRVQVEFDEFAGILRIKVQAYDSKMAEAIATMLVQEGERYMNHLGHEMAQAQVDFLIKQVDTAQHRFQQASQDLLNYQNKEGMISPAATAESIGKIIAGLETQRAQFQTQLAALPKTLDRNHQNILMLKQSLAAVDKQIAQEKLKLATPGGGTLNASVEQYHRLEMQAQFTQDMYRSALTALEKGRIDATRMLEKVSILQTATLAEYPKEPRRGYNAMLTLLIALMIAGMLKLLKSIVLDHVD